MGEKSEEILLQFDTVPTTAETMLNKFSEYFQPRVNIIFERYLFNKRCQKEFETIEEFISSVHKLAENCKFGDLKEELIRDRIVVGVKNQTISEKMQLKADLTLKDAVLIARQAESQILQSKIMTQDSSNVEVNAIQRPRRNSKVKCCFFLR